MFNGNCYSPEWEEEARRRGLFVAKGPTEALGRLVSKENTDLLGRLGVMGHGECRILCETRLEQHVKWTEIEMSVMRSMVQEGVLPALGRGAKEETELLGAISSLGLEDGGCHTKRRVKLLLEARSAVAEGLKDLEGALGKLKELGGTSDLFEACRFSEECQQVMGALREEVDKGEEMCPEDLWGYPRYRQLLSLG
jgi:glutamine synthetase